MLHRRGAHRDVIAGISAALVVGAVRADVVAVEVHRLAQARPPTIAEPPSPSCDTARVVSLTQRRLSDPDGTFAALPPDRRPAPSVAAYDELLPRRAAASTQSGAAAPGASSEVS